MRSLRTAQATLAPDSAMAPNNSGNRCQPAEFSLAERPPDRDLPGHHKRGTRCCMSLPERGTRRPRTSLPTPKHFPRDRRRPHRRPRFDTSAAFAVLRGFLRARRGEVYRRRAAPFQERGCCTARTRRDHQPSGSRRPRCRRCAIGSHLHPHSHRSQWVLHRSYRRVACLLHGSTPGHRTSRCA